MPVYKAKTHIDTYRLKATSDDVTELNARPGRHDLSEFIANQIYSRLPIHNHSVVLDIGCGDGTLLQKCAKNGSGEYFGILPTTQEIDRLREHLEHIGADNIKLIRSTCEEIPLPDNFIDAIVINGVIPLIESDATLDKTIIAIERVLKPGGTVYFGELMKNNSHTDIRFGDSISLWLLHSLFKQGPRSFFKKTKLLFNAIFSNTAFVIAPKSYYTIEQNDFSQRLIKLGFTIDDLFSHTEIDINGNSFVNTNRWNLIASKPS